MACFRLAKISLPFPFTMLPSLGASFPAPRRFSNYLNSLISSKMAQRVPLLILLLHPTSPQNISHFYLSPRVTLFSSHHWIKHQIHASHWLKFFQFPATSHYLSFSNAQRTHLSRVTPPFPLFKSFIQSHACIITCLNI